jgi:hypothetical protein
METSTFNILSGLSRPIQNFDPIGSYNQGRQMREDWDQSGRLNELRQKLPSMIQNIRTKFPELGEKLDSLAEVAKVDPMGAYKMLVSLSDGNQANRDNVTIAKWREVALNAKNDGYNILGEAQQAPKEKLGEFSNRYLNAYKSYNSAISEMQKAGSTDTGVGQLGAMKPFAQAMQEYEKDQVGFKRSQSDLQTALTNERSAKFNYDQNLVLAPYKKAEAQAGAVKSGNEASISATQAQKQVAERPVVLGKMRALINNIVAFAKDLSSNDEKKRASSANLLLTQAGKAVMGALSNDEFGNLTGNKDANWKNWINTYNPLASVKSASPEIAHTQGLKLYQNLNEEYNSILETFTPEEKAMVKGSVLPFPSLGQGNASTQTTGAPQTDAPPIVSKKGRKPL